MLKIYFENKFVQVQKFCLNISRSNPSLTFVFLETKGGGVNGLIGFSKNLSLAC